MAQASFLADRERQQFVHWLRTGRLTDRALGDGAVSPEFKFNPWHDPADGRFAEANTGRYFGPGSGPASLPATDGSTGRSTGHSDTALPPQPTRDRMDGPEIVVTAPHRPKVGSQRVWPVKGGGTPAVRNAIGSNGRRYADGRFSREGLYRIDRKTGKHRAHMGVDLPGEPGDPVVAAADGVVVNIRHAGESKDFGNAIVIRHLDGTTTGYAHLQTIEVGQSQQVKMGTHIGTMGNTGNAHGMGTHLHFEVAPPGSEALRKGLRRSDPSHWISMGAHR